VLRNEGKPDTRNLLRKIFITVTASAATFAATTSVKEKDVWPLLLSVFVGGVTLVVQFLLEVEARQASVEAGLVAFARSQREVTQQLEASVKAQLEGFNQANSLLARLDSGPLGRESVLTLVQHSADLNRSAPALTHRLAAAEILTVSNFLKDLGRGSEVAADGDGWPWTFILTNNAEATIDATSHMARGGSDEGLWDDDLWTSELGLRYLDLQSQAIQRGVVIRRIFILETWALAENVELRRICDLQCARGIDVRLIDVATATGMAGSHIPMVIFDKAVSFELTPSRFQAAFPGFVKTTLVLNPFQVHERFEMFQRLWGGGMAYERTLGQAKRQDT
jgi:hypothetical protein